MSREEIHNPMLALSKEYPTFSFCAKYLILGNIASALFLETVLLDPFQHQGKRYFQRMKLQFTRGV